MKRQPPPLDVHRQPLLERGRPVGVEVPTLDFEVPCARCRQRLAEGREALATHPACAAHLLSAPTSAR